MGYPVLTYGCIEFRYRAKRWVRRLRARRKGKPAPPVVATSGGAIERR
jgi:hypothetical protein